MPEHAVPMPSRHPISQLDTPVLAPAAAQMNVEIVINEKADVWLLHSAAFAETIKWAEYDLDLNKLYLVLLSGRQQEIGFPIPDKLANNLKNAAQLFLIQMTDEKIADCGVVPLFVRGALQQRIS